GARLLSSYPGGLLTSDRAGQLFLPGAGLLLGGPLVDGSGDGTDANAREEPAGGDAEDDRNEPAFDGRQFRRVRLYLSAGFEGFVRACKEKGPGGSGPVIKPSIHTYSGGSSP